MAKYLTAIAMIALVGCSAPEFRAPEAVTDGRLNGVWLAKSSELGGKSIPIPAEFELHLAGTQYRAGIPPPGDRGKIILFGDELAGQAARMDVVGEEGPNKGKRYLAIYRFRDGPAGRELEICYDLSQQSRPSEFVSREGTQVLRVTYAKQ
jgi:uncharacterized protein (TIGR03067 family)